MKETFAILLLSLIYLGGSYKFHFLLLKAKKSQFILLCAAYFLLTFFLYAGAVYLHQYLRDRGIHFEFGHAEESLVEIFLLWVILTFINVIIVLARRNFGKKDTSNSA
jgi:lysylphosphatidylglycerol synthetase-like protein (DUF2156 family)